MGTKASGYRAALYMRLSKDDEGCGESASIKNQRNILLAYARENEFTVAGEYADDGYSGTNFARPQFQRLLRDIEAQKIDMVLTKDLSRLGRDYIQTGRYTEDYFPEKKVRFIAVNDAFDSEGPSNDIAPFKNVMNELYARDTSRKIRSAFAAKMQAGAYIGSFAPYGYQKDGSDKNHLVPDPIAAAVVQEIFARAEAGARPAEIADVLNQKQVLPPALYRCVQHPRLEAKPHGWTAAGVTKLLHSVVYRGHMAQGKTTKLSFKSKTTLRNPAADWIVVKNTHEALVSEAAFQAAHRRLEGRACEGKGQFSNLFSGLAKCADCGESMSTVGTRKKGSPANLACGGYKRYGKAACTNHFIDYTALYSLVLEAVGAHGSLSEAEGAAVMHELEARLERELGAHAGGELLARWARTERAIAQLYEDRLDGKLTEPRFLKLLEQYETQGRALRAEMDGPQSLQERHPAAEGQLAQAAAPYSPITVLTANLLFALIDRIEVGQGQYEQGAGGRVKRQQITIWFRFLT